MEKKKAAKKSTKKKSAKKTVSKKESKNIFYKVGRPPIYKTAKELQDKIQEYFMHGRNTRTVITKTGIIEVPIVTITGLVLYLGFESRTSFYDLEKKKEFMYTIKRARSFIEQEYEGQLQSSSCVGAIFALKNFGWKDKTEHELSGGLVNLNTNITKEEAFKRLDEIKARIKNGKKVKKNP